MKLTTRMPGATTAAGLVSLTASALLITGCGSSSGSSATATAAVKAPASSAAAATSAVAAAGAAVTIQTKTAALGTYLTDQAGRTLYVFAADTGSTSTCNAGCTTYWPPLTGTAKAGSGIQASALGSSARSDGSKQVTYDGHPLYYFAGDKTPGSTAGQGSTGSGAKWWVVGVDGKAITTTASSSGGAPSASATTGSKY